LMAERTDEGDRLFFVPQDKEVPENVLVARATTEEASFPETDTDVSPAVAAARATVAPWA